MFYLYILTTQGRKEKLPLTITSEKIKYLGINLPNEAKDLHSKNYKTQVKEIKDYIHK